MNFFADMHTHTCASTHAFSTITENARWASEHGITRLAMTDHSLDMPDAPHIWHFYNMRIIPDELFGVKIIRGIEADIKNEKGELDIYEDYLYDCLQWVNASMHDCVIEPTTKSAHTAAYIAVLNNPHVDVLCHTDDPRFDYDFDEVCAECARKGRLMEINVSRLLRDGRAEGRYKLMLEACGKYGTNVIINSDAHFYTAIGTFEKAESLLAQVGFPEELVLNASEERVDEYLKKRAERIRKGE